MYGYVNCPGLLLGTVQFCSCDQHFTSYTCLHLMLAINPKFHCNQSNSGSRLLYKLCYADQPTNQSHGESYLLLCKLCLWWYNQQVICCFYLNLKQLKRLLHWSVSPRRIRWVKALDFICLHVADVCMATTYQLYGILVQLAKVVGGMCDLPGFIT